MFTSVSSIHPLKCALVDRFTADPAIGNGGAPDAPLVTFGLPSAPRRSLPRDWIAVGNSHPDNPTSGTPNFDGGQSVANLAPNQKREERYTMDCMVSVLRGKLDDQRTVNGIAFAYSGAMETSLRIWQKQANACDLVVRWCLVSDMWHNDGVNPEGERFCNVFMNLAVSNRLD